MPVWCVRVYVWSSLGVKKNHRKKTNYLKVGLCETSRHSDHGGGERAGDPDGGQELRDVWRQAEWNGSVSIQVACGVIYVEAEVRHIQLACVLKVTNKERLLLMPAVLHRGCFHEKLEDEEKCENYKY